MEAILFIGLQASGKSSFYRERFFDTHLRISLDLVRTRHRERRLLELCLELGQPFVVDNTNPTPEDRARYIPRAREAGFRRIGYYFSSKAEECIRRNQAREGRSRVPDAAIRGTSGRLELPSLGEGLDELYFVRLKPGGGFLVEEWNDEIR